MRHRFLVTMAIALAIACGNDKQPPAGPAPTAAVSARTLKALTINGRARIAPGETEAFEAIGQLSDGTTQVYTTLVQWHSPCPYVMSMDNSGKLTAVRAGECTITASFQGVKGSLSVMVIAPGTFRLAGAVLEAGLPVVAATVKIKSGQGAGSETATDDRGQYRFYGVVGPVDVQVSKSGYPTVIKTISVASDELLDFPGFAQSGSVPTVGGAYTLTLTAASHCAQPFGPARLFPPEANVRTYSALVTQDGPRLTVALSGARFQRGNQFNGHIEPGGVSFTLGSAGGHADYYGYYYYPGLPDVAELLPNGQYFSYFGTVSTTATPSGMSGLIHGWATLFIPGPDGTPVSSFMCQGSHGFSLTPQTGATRVRR